MCVIRVRQRISFCGIVTFKLLNRFQYSFSNESEIPCGRFWDLEVGNDNVRRESTSLLLFTDALSCPHDNTSM